MQLNTELRARVGNDVQTFTRTQVMELHTQALLEAIGKAANLEVSHIVKDLPDITGLQLLQSLTCDLGSPSKVLMRIQVLFDWDAYRLTVARDGERVAMLTIPSTTTFPAMQAQAAALARLVKAVTARADLSQANWTYDFDPTAVQLRGSAWIEKRLGTVDKTEETKARYSAFQSGYSVRQTLDDSPHQSLVVSVSKEL